MANAENIYSGLLTTGNPHRIWVFYTKNAKEKFNTFIPHVISWAGGCISCTLKIYYETVGVISQNSELYYQYFFWFTVMISYYITWLFTCALGPSLTPNPGHSFHQPVIVLLNRNYVSPNVHCLCTDFYISGTLELRTLPHYLVYNL